jgi:glycosyltransferase involved in cell wall biosynthesis
MNWLVFEDSLESRKGHWLEYLDGFARELPKLGDKMILLVSRHADPNLCAHFSALPVLPESVCLKVSDVTPVLRRYARVPTHAWKTFWAARGFFKQSLESEIIFVPTMTVHHLLGWFWLIKTSRRNSSARVLLFFPGLPICRRESAATLDGSPTSSLMRFLLRRLAKEIRAGMVVLGVETEAMRQAGEQAFGVPFTYFPHPVQPCEEEKAETQKTGTANSGLRTANSDRLVFASYGAGRHEKGSDVLVTAIEQYLSRFPNSQVKFVFQWLDDFLLPDGKIASIPWALQQQTRVEIVTRLFDAGEYSRRLKQVDVLLLPYRQSSYGLRVSRLAIEAMVNGIPVIVTHGTTLAEQGEKFGTVVLCEDENVESLVEAIRETEQNFPQLKEHAERQKALARKQFSVEEFRRRLIG